MIMRSLWPKHCLQDQYHSLWIFSPAPCTYADKHMEVYVIIPQGGPSGELINPECVVDLAGTNRYEILLKVEEPGHYVGCVKYEGQTIGPPCITIICLSGELVGLLFTVHGERGETVPHGRYAVFFIPTDNALFEKKLTFRLLYCSLHQSIRNNL